MTGASVLKQLGDVSRETVEDLEKFAALLEKWNPAINLVSSLTLRQIWTRHFLDSAQLFRLAKNPARHWVDLGSGAGFPGMVIACMARRERPDLRVTCIESDQRKSEFLRTVARELELDVKILPERIEKVPPLRADIVSARALAPLDGLLAFARRHLDPTGLAIFPKGAGYQAEVEQAAENWTFDIEIEPSITDTGGVILTLGGIRRA